jgi:hypothetical protein
LTTLDLRSPVHVIPPLVQDLYKQRKQLVSRTCRRYGLGNFPPPEKVEEGEAGLYRDVAT